MQAELFSVSGLALMFVLGLRHGVDPDHIACIDGLTWRALEHNSQHARWIGTLFALGHGLLITVIAAVVSQLTHGVEISPLLATVFGWVPTALLILIGSLNLCTLLRSNTDFAPLGWKSRLIPKRWQQRTSPWTVIVIGVLFATVFDTATQASAWAYVASSNGGLVAALLAGLAFTVGMVIIDTLDGRLVCRIGDHDQGHALGLRYRRTLGWMIVCMSYGVAAYNLALVWIPQIELGDSALLCTGLALILVIALFFLFQSSKISSIDA